MFSTVRHWLSSTPIADELRRRHAVTLQLLFLFVGLAVPAIWLPRLLGTTEFSGVDAVASLVMAGVAWTALILLRRGRYDAAVWTFIGALQLAIVIAYASTGLLAQKPSQAPHSLALLLAALLIGRRALWTMAGVLLLALLLGLLADLGAGRPRALSALFSVGFSFLMVAIVLDRFATSLVEVVARYRERTEALDAANARIRAEAADRERLQRALNTAQQRDAAELVSSGLAHELNNVLALTYAQLARVDATTPEHARAFARVKDSLDDAAERIARVLNKVRRDELELTDVDVGRLVHRLEPDLRALLGPKRTLTLDLQPAPVVCAVETDVAQILLALIANAAEATCGEGGGQVWITLYRGRQTEQDGLCLRVADNGRGMTSAQLAEVGNALFSPNSARAEAEGVGGLGLATCRALAERVGGTLAVRPGIGSGTEVEVWLPLVQVEAQPVLDVRVVDPHSVLLVDDDPDVGALLSFVLSSAGFAVEIAETADAARLAQQRLSGQPQPLVVMDRNLPDGDGVALLEEFSRQQNGMRVVFSSVQALKAHERERLKRIQLVELAKPYVPERLVETLRSLGQAA